MVSRFDFTFSTDRVVCDGAAPATLGEVAQTVRALRAQLPQDEPRVVVSCRDRYWLLVSCLASWAERRSVVLAANDKPGAIQEVMNTTGARTWLTDQRTESTPFTSVIQVDTLPTQKVSHGSLEDSEFSVAGENIVATFFTSGTTGQPEGVDKTARQLLGEAETLVRLFSIDERNVFAATVPAHHLYGFLFSLLVPYLGGARFVRETPFQPAAVVDNLERFAVTDLVTVPAHLRALLTVAPSGDAVQRVFSSGAVLEPAIARDFVQRTRARVVDVLGSTETGGIASREPAVDETYRPLPGVELERGADGNARLTSAFLDDPNSGAVLSDRVEFVPGGFRFEGRADGVLKIAGNRISVQELERVSRSLPGVRDAAIVVVETPSVREREPWLLLVSEDKSWTLEKLRDALSAHFDRVVLPRRLRVLDELPRNALGKLERATALALFERTEEEEVTGIFPVPADWVFFHGHFRTDPLLPGVAQLTEVVLPRAREAWPELGPVHGIKRLKFKRPIRPGETLAYRIQYARGAMELWFELAVEGELAATGTLLVGGAVSDACNVGGA